MRSSITRVLVAAVAVLIFTSLISGSAGSEEKVVPSIEEVLSLRTGGGGVISPDGKSVAFTVRSTDWKENRYDTEVWLVHKGGRPFQLTRTSGGSSTSPSWSPCGKWIAFLADRGEGRQVFLIGAGGGEAQAVTFASEGVSYFEWAPSGMRIAYISAEKKSEEMEKREKRFGKFAVEDGEYGFSHLWLTDIVPDMWPSPAEVPCFDSDAEATDPGENDSAETESNTDEAADCPKHPEAKRLTGGEDYTVTGMAWAPDGKRIAVVHQKDSNIISFSSSDISILEVQTGTMTPLITTTGNDETPVWSPDSKWIAYTSAHGDTLSDYYANNHLLLIRASGGEVKRVAEDYDGIISRPEWKGDRIYFIGWDGTDRHIYHVDPDKGKAKVFSDRSGVVWGMDFSRGGEAMCFSMQDAGSISEIYMSPAKKFKPVAMTSMTSQIEGWATGTSEVISWESRDGTMIEGVLHRPEDFDPGRSYPLLVLIHGGPAWIDFPVPVFTYVYPVTQWLAKGCVVLRPNYRGSLGYGEKFRSLNVRNVGVGDSWDVLSGVDHLIDEGIAHPDSLGAMGWSQGGYISAFLTTRTDRFRAISVGAGISNWITYYVSTDVHPWTRQYLKATPWDDPEIYALTSPITTVKDAVTPTLIQHGEFDRRVPTPNGYELYQGLQDVGVDTRLIIYKEFGHGIMKPKERLAGAMHNWNWFERYLWGKEVESP